MIEFAAPDYDMARQVLQRGIVLDRAGTDQPRYVTLSDFSSDEIDRAISELELQLGESSG